MKNAHSPARHPSSPVRLTYNDLRGLPDDGMRHELIDGEHIVTPAPSGCRPLTSTSHSDAPGCPSQSMATHFPPALSR